MIKNLLLTLALSCGACCVANAQLSEPVNTNGWMGSVEFDPATFSVDKGAKGCSFSMRITATHQIMDYLSGGFGVSLDQNWNFQTAPSLNIFGRLHAEDFRRKFSPFVELDMGYDQSFQDVDVRSFMFNPTVGVRYGHFGFGVGYLGHAANGGVGSAINIRLAYYFGYHKTAGSEKFAKFMRDMKWGVGLKALIPFGNGKVISNEAQVTSSIGGGLELSGLYPFSNKFSAGLMLGFDVLNVNVKEPADRHSPVDFWEYSENYFSIIAALRGRYDITQAEFSKLNLHPYVSLDLGLSSNLIADEWHESFYYSPTVGLAMPVKNNTQSVDLGIGIAPAYMDKNGGRYIGEKGFHGVPGLKISLGYTF